MCDTVKHSSVIINQQVKNSSHHCPNQAIMNTATTQTDNSNITHVKSSHIGEALDLLRKELVLLQEQDVLLLKQLMNVHYSIRMLKRKLTRRSNSFTTLAPQLSLMINAYSNSTKTLPPHSSLSRVMSEPSKTMIYQRSFSINEEDEEEEDELAESFNSGDSDTLDPLKFSLNIDPEINALLTDMPKSLRRKYLTSLNHNSYAIPSSGSSDKLEQEQKNSSTTATKTLSSSSSRRNDSLKPHRNPPLHMCSYSIKKLPIPNGLCSETVNEDISYESDSSGGIEITAL